MKLELAIIFTMVALVVALIVLLYVLMTSDTQYEGTNGYVQCTYVYKVGTVCNWRPL